MGTRVVEGNTDEIVESMEGGSAKEGGRKYMVNGDVVGKGVKMKGKYGLRRKIVKKYIDAEDLLAELTQLSKKNPNRLGVGTRTKHT